jgi:hypothetical protein
LQLGRLDECIQHYTILQNSLIALATELDNFPTEDTDAYEGLDAFPDKIMRSDPLNDHLPVEEIIFPKLQIPACKECNSFHVS